MGLDGFSMGNLGLNTEITSAQITSQAEHFAQKEAKIEVKTINESTEDSSVKRKKDEEEGNKQTFDHKFKQQEEEQQQESNQGILDSNFDEKMLETSDPKEFLVRVNPKTEKIELFNTKNEKIVETIAAQDLMNIMAKLDSASGVLINRKI